MFRWMATGWLAFLSIFLTCSLHAQLTEGTLKGVVLDPTGSAIVASHITVKNESTGQERSAETDGSATFIITALSPGAYKITITATSFKTFEQSGIKVNVGQTTDLA